MRPLLGNIFPSIVAKVLEGIKALIYDYRRHSLLCLTYSLSYCPYQRWWYTLVVTLMTSIEKYTVKSVLRVVKCCFVLLLLKYLFHCKTSIILLEIYNKVFIAMYTSMTKNNLYYFNNFIFTKYMHYYLIRNLQGHFFSL